MSRNSLYYKEALLCPATVRGWEIGEKSPKLRDLRILAERLGYEVCLKPINGEGEEYLPL